MASKLEWGGASEIGHVLLIDIVGFSKLLVNAQIKVLQELNRIVRNTETFRAAEAEQKLTKLPTGDGMALIFLDAVESPLRCALEVATAVRDQPAMNLRMGVHSGPIKQVNDVNERENFAGAGINIAQRVLDCGDSGHILVSQRVAEDLMPHEEWHAALRDVGECEVKHGLRVHLFNLCSDGVGNPALPAKLKEQRRVFQRGRALWFGPRALSRRKKLILLGSGVAFAGAIALLLYLLWPVPKPEKTVVILPFESRSDARGDEHLADGVADEIREQLGRLDGLMVVRSRQPLPDASRISAGYLLGGSVQRSGDQILIRVWLINPKEKTNEWGEHVTREVAKLFSAQREIAEKTAAELHRRLALKGNLPTQVAPTTDGQAYTSYLQGKTLIDVSILSTRAHQDLLEATELLTRAVERDPTFFLAYYQLAHAQDQLYFRFEHNPQRLREADAAVRTLQLARPSAGETHLAVAKHLYWAYRNYEAARAELTAAEPSLPDDPYRLLLAGYIDRRESKWESSSQNLERAREMDPQNTAILQQIAFSQFMLRHYDDAIATFDEIVRLSPGDIDLRARRASLLFEKTARPEAFQEVFSLARAMGAKEWSNIANDRFYVALCEHDKAAAQEAVQSLTPGGCGVEPLAIPNAWCEGLAARLVGDEGAAADAFARAAAEAEQQLAVDPQSAATLCVAGLTHAGVGLKEQAIREGREAAALLPPTEDAVDGILIAEYLAVIFAVTGENERAVEQIGNVTAGPGSLCYGALKLHPYWDGLRGDPHFEAILARLKPKDD